MNMNEIICDYDFKEHMDKTHDDMKRFASDMKKYIEKEENKYRETLENIKFYEAVLNCKKIIKIIKNCIFK
jgi:hypothetical protein